MKNTNTQKEDTNKFFSETPQKGWLQRLKEESWEAELLVSAISIYSTFQLFNGISWATNFFIDVLNPNQYYAAYFIVFFGLIAISVLAAMFVIHFFLRAYWIGLVGLNSVFPDYSIEDSAYSKIYTKKILSILPKLKGSIHKVDELCSVIFSAAFTFLLSFGYIALFSCIYLLLYNLLSDYISTYILLAPWFLIFSGMMFQSIITIISNLKANKEKEKLQILNFKLVKIVYVVVYGPLYKSILQVSMIFGSNFKKKKSLIHLIILFLFSGLFVAILQIPKTNIFYLIQYENYFDANKTYSEYYKSSNHENYFLLAPEIESDKITSKAMQVFIPVFDHEIKTRETICDEYNNDSSKEKKEQRQDRAEYLLECYKKYIHVYINDNKVAVDFLRYHKHPKTKQFGLLCFIKMNDLPTGLHYLKVEKKGKEKIMLDWEIPFYFAPNMN